MTERFVVPEKLLMNGGYIHPSDLPAIVRAEVADALQWSNGQWRENSDLRWQDRDYLTARYGPAPDNERSPSPDNDSREALRAPTFTREAEALLEMLMYLLGRTAFQDPQREVLREKVIREYRAYLASREGR